MGTNMKETICAIILTKNEDIHLSRVLDQISKLMDNILIVDSGSTDQTFQIAKNIDVILFLINLKIIQHNLILE